MESHRQLCLWCHTHNLSEDGPRHPRHGLKLLLRYLNIDILKVVGVRSSADAAAVEKQVVLDLLWASLCEECGAGVQVFAELFQRLEGIRLQISEGIQWLSDRLAGSNNDKWEGNEEDVVVRKEIIMKCNQKLSSIPQVQLQRVDSNCNKGQAQYYPNALKLQVEEEVGVWDVKQESSLPLLPPSQYERSNPTNRMDESPTVKHCNDTDSSHVVKVFALIDDPNSQSDEEEGDQVSSDHVISQRDVIVTDDDYVKLETLTLANTNTNQENNNLKHSSPSKANKKSRLELIRRQGLVCHACKKCFTSKRSLKLHSQLHQYQYSHKPAAISTTSTHSPRKQQKVFKCEYCPEKYDAESLRDHQLASHTFLLFSTQLPPDAKPEELEAAIDAVAGRVRIETKTGRWNCIMCSLLCSKKSCETAALAFRTHLLHLHLEQVLAPLMRNKENVRPVLTPTPLQSQGQTTEGKSSSSSPPSPEANNFEDDELLKELLDTSLPLNKPRKFFNRPGRYYPSSQQGNPSLTTCHYCNKGVIRLRRHLMQKHSFEEFCSIAPHGVRVTEEGLDQTLTSLWNRVTTDRNGTNYKLECSLCQKMFSSRAYLYSHLKDWHSDFIFNKLRQDKDSGGEVTSLKLGIIN